MTATL